MFNNSLKSIVILGGGSAGWMTAAALSSLLDTNKVSVTVVESEDIGTVGVGEATIPDIINFNRILGISEEEFMKATHATFKLGIEFNNWGKQGDSYFHPFGTHGVDMNGIDFHQYWLYLQSKGDRSKLEDYSINALAAEDNKFCLSNNDPRSPLSLIRHAYHFDATRYAHFLRDYAEKRGVKRIEGKVQDVQQDSETGHVTSLILESEQSVSGEFFFDCTGFRSLLLTKTLGVPFNDWSHWLPCDSALAVPSERAGPLLPYTKSTAKSSGWQWRIPTQDRVGNGHIYASDFISDSDAEKSLLDDLDGAPLADPRQLRFKTGCLEKFWEKNCIAIGLSAGFLEPLESTSIYLIQMGISRFIALFPDASLSDVIRDEYNRHMRQQFDQVRDFIILHYCATERTDSDFWNYCRTMSIPESLERKIDLFKQGGRIFRYEDELFATPSWLAVMIGQNISPVIGDPIVASLPFEQVEKSLKSMNMGMKRTTAQMPSHQDFINQYCKAPAS
ncbi:tryptophan 7-halogenase [Temperatibacter marinus]|uniref:Tryptophan 7-halogenase n=1 Tax=Temperatibacter marinus TaxID=1456591 RepID=A0AA52HA40_9PROT|nr:tryptophan halogenase family protein [Temperatibacter marinus]WND03579.1 tryptophan 7-halogenase [Temperatibacter marinus]